MLLMLRKMGHKTLNTKLIIKKSLQGIKLPIFYREGMVIEQLFTHISQKKYFNFCANRVEYHIFFTHMAL